MYLFESTWDRQGAHFRTESTGNGRPRRCGVQLHDSAQDRSAAGAATSGVAADEMRTERLYQCAGNGTTPTCTTSTWLQIIRQSGHVCIRSCLRKDRRRCIRGDNALTVCRACKQSAKNQPFWAPEPDLTTPSRG